MRTAVKSRRRRPKSASALAQRTPQASEPAYYSKAIGRALDVLELFRDGETNLSLMDISKMGGVPESSLFRVLLTLEARGYLLRGADGSYKLAPRLLFGKLHERAQQVRELVRPFLKQLNARFNETASLAFLFQDKIEVVDTLEAIQEIRRSNTVGRIVPPHSSSLGKAIVAFQDKAVIDRILRINGLSARTGKTITDPGAVLEEFEQIRRQGYSVDREESIPGGVCYGAPLEDEHHHVVAGISVSIPLIRMTPEREHEIIQALLQVSREGSRAIQAQAEPG